MDSVEIQYYCSQLPQYDGLCFSGGESSYVRLLLRNQAREFGVGDGNLRGEECRGNRQRME